MDKKEVMIIADYSSETPLSLAELCDICHVNSDLINTLIEYEIIHPQDASRLTFNLRELKRAQAALRLQRDLELNMAGIGMLLDLIEEMEKMRARMELLEKHFINL